MEKDTVYIVNMIVSLAILLKVKPEDLIKQMMDSSAAAGYMLDLVKSGIFIKKDNKKDNG